MAEELDPDSSASETGDSYEFQGPKNNLASSQTTTAFLLLSGGNYGDPPRPGHSVTEGLGKKRTPSGPSTSPNPSVHSKYPEGTPRPCPSALYALDD